jgi:hypothetical protein
MAAGTFFFTWLNGHIIELALHGIIVNILLVAAGIALIVKEKKRGGGFRSNDSLGTSGAPRTY